MSSATAIYIDVPQPPPPSPVYNLQRALADAFTFVRSAEVNQAFASVTLDQLINDQIARNGDSSESGQSKYDPYSFTPGQTPPASTQTPGPVNDLGGADTNAPTRLDRLTALLNNIQAVVQAVQNTPVVEVAVPSAYASGAQTTTPTTPTI